jgi:hypothetical protein
MSIMMTVTESLPLALGDTVDNSFHCHILIYLYALARDESVHFILIAVLFCAVANRVSHLSRFPSLSSEIGKSDTNKNTKHVV